MRSEPCPPSRRKVARVTGIEVMGIVNVTPDSFSDGGLWAEPDAAVGHGLALARGGATILDIGGESTRPGAEPVTLARDLRRVVPVVEGLASLDLSGVRISVDTTKAGVAEAALEAGASIVNDVSACTADPAMADVVARSGCEVCLMHMQGGPQTMQDAPEYEDVVAEVKSYLQVRVEALTGAGVDPSRIWLDPGIGFGKTLGHNLELLRRLDEISALGFPVAIGTSRKRFIGKVSGAQVGERLPGSLASMVMALERGANVFRVHDVAESVQALKVAAATLRGVDWHVEGEEDLATWTR